MLSIVECNHVMQFIVLNYKTDNLSETNIFILSKFETLLSGFEGACEKYLELFQQEGNSKYFELIHP